jgi:hypothetical protein
LGRGEGLKPGMIGFFRRTGEFEGVFIAVEYAGEESYKIWNSVPLFGIKLRKLYIDDEIN